MDMISPTKEDNVKYSVEHAADKTASEAQNKIAQFKGKMENIGSRLDTMACAAGKEASELATNVGHKVSSAADCVTAEIRKKPVQSAAIALTVGILGTLLYKRSA